MFARIAALVALLITVGCTAACAVATPTKPTKLDGPVRGTWMTTTANDALASPKQTAKSMKTLAHKGFNTVYVECWKNGYTEFPSDVMDELIGVPMKINNTPAELQRDLLGEMIREGHANDLRVIGWF
ncbi:MAG: family 10 glycosylhydrolase, partial [Planctomycetota bacterium]